MPNNHQSKSDFIEASCTLACKHPVNCLLRPLMLDVVVLFFLFGLLAGLVRSELKLPPALYDTLSLFLLLAIGLKGGVGLAQQSLLPLLPQLALVILLGVVQTLAGFALLRIKMNRIDAAATAAHYGSVSVADLRSRGKLAHRARHQLRISALHLPSCDGNPGHPGGHNAGARGEPPDPLAHAGP
ncbi:hypothetical protein ASA01S_108_00055 [Aeromonas salmonicida subsp. masoucida NBRC 13784]|nr:hypothetical protein ASA01S_108_00055 [Aeromonas salmonicida subsp. masoucida NBRC 13784]